MTPLEIKRKCSEDACRIQSYTMWYMWMGEIEDVDLEIRYLRCQGGYKDELVGIHNVNVDADIYAVLYAVKYAAAVMRDADDD